MAAPSADIAGLRPRPLSAGRPPRRGVPLWPLVPLLLLLPLAAALVVRSLAGDPAYHGAMARAGLKLIEPRWKEIAEAAAAALCLALALAAAAPSRMLCAAERAIARFAAHKTRAVAAAGLLPLALRLALLPVLGVPEPVVADEFGYLLLADTFASGRLANPPHPLWQHFESIYVLHQPAYTSIYPAAPAVLMAAAKVAGAAPWVGVWLGVGLMCALICWMLQGWVPPKWALLGGLLAACRFGVAGPWMNTYWGGAAAAAGGALVVGALPRVLRRGGARDALLFGLGLAVLAHSRPYEGLLMSAPLTLALAGWLWKRRRARAALSLGLAAAALAAGTAYYNRRATGSWLRMPYAHHQKLYGTPQPFYWQAPVPDAPGIHRAGDIADVFRWQLDAWRSGFTWRGQGERMAAFWRFYLQPLLTLPLLFVPLLLYRRRRLGLLFLAAAAVPAGNALYPFFFPHYAAPVCGVAILFVVEGLRRMRRVRLGRRRAGVVAVHAVLGAVALSSAATTAGGLLRPRDVVAADTPRAQAIAQMEELGGRHLVLARYGPDHSFHHPVVHNGAEIDAAPIVWARDLGPEANRRLAASYPGRYVWLFDPDEEPVTLVPLSGKPYISVLACGAGKRDDRRTGVSPGSIAVLLGGNFAGGIEGATSARAVLGPLPVEPAGASSVSGQFFRAASGREIRPAAGGPDIAVRFGGIAAPVLGVQNFGGRQAVAIRVPEDVPQGPATVTLETRGAAAKTHTHILPAAPGIFQMRMEDGRLRAVLARQDGALVDLERPARRGEVLRLFATGIHPRFPVVAGVNHRGARLVEVRAAPWQAGVYEVIFEVPADAPSGRDVPLAIAAIVDGAPVFGNKSSLPVE